MRNDINNMKFLFTRGGLKAMKLKTIIIGLLLFAVSNAFSQENPNPYGLSSIEAVQSTLTITGNVVHQPLMLYPPKPDAYPLELGSIDPGGSKLFIAEGFPGAKSLFCGVLGTHGYNVNIKVNMELEKNGVHIEPVWSIFPSFGGNEPIPLSYVYSPGNTQFEHNQVINGTGGFQLRTTIKKLRADDGAPVGDRLFKFTLTFCYAEI